MTFKELFPSWYNNGDIYGAFHPPERPHSNPPVKPQSQAVRQSTSEGRAQAVWTWYDLQKLKLFPCITLLGLTFLMSVTAHFPTRQENMNTVLRGPKLGFAFMRSGSYH